MARIRTVKPDFWKHEELSELPEVVHMFAAALLNYSDDEGFFNANPKLIKAELFPLREPSMNVHGMLSELSKIGYIKLYKGVDGKTYGHVVNFLEHQKVNRPQASKYKGLIEFTEQSLIDHEQLTAGKERKGKERKGTLSGDNEKKVSEKPKTKYTEQFEHLWKTASDLYRKAGSPIGNKFEAWESFEKIAVCDERISFWLTSLESQAAAKEKILQAGKEPTQFKHFSRWLKNECWDDQPDPTPIDPRKEAVSQGPARKELFDPRVA